MTTIWLERASTVRSQVRDSALRLGRYVKSSESDDVDASILWLSTPFRVVEPSDRYFAETVRTIEAAAQPRRRTSPISDRHVFRKWGLAGAHCLAWLALPVCRRPGRGKAKRGTGSPPISMTEGRLGEQFGGERRDPEHYREWVERWGPPAKDLTWSHAMYVVLCTGARPSSLEPHTGPFSIRGRVADRESTVMTGLSQIWRPPSVGCTRNKAYQEEDRQRRNQCHKDKRQETNQNRQGRGNHEKKQPIKVARQGHDCSSRSPRSGLVEHWWPSPGPARHRQRRQRQLVPRRQ